MDKKEYKDCYRDGFLVSAQMQKVWDIELEMAKHVIDVCKRHNLRIFLDAGTLLGAVRHKGFIPWDDDIDLAMPRPDYDKLMKLADTEFPHPFFLQNSYTDPHHFLGHAQVRNVETTAISEKEIDGDYCKGIFIDIFVLDGFIETPILRFLHRCTIKAIKWFLYRWPSKQGFALFERIFRMASLKNKMWGDFAFRYRSMQARPGASYSGTVDMEFENLMLPAPQGWHEVLVHCFGEDYMTPKQQPTCHGTKLYDTERSYKVVQEELKAHPERLKASN